MVVLTKKIKCTLPSTRSRVVSLTKFQLYPPTLNAKLRGAVNGKKNVPILNAKLRGLIDKIPALAPYPQREVAWSR